MLSSTDLTDSSFNWDYTVNVEKPGQDAQDALWVKLIYNLPIVNSSNQLFQHYGDAQSKAALLMKLFQALARYTESYKTLGPLLSQLASSGTVDQGTPKEVLSQAQNELSLVSDALIAYFNAEDESELDAPEPPLYYVVDFSKAYGTTPHLIVYSTLEDHWPVINTYTAESITQNREWTSQPVWYYVVVSSYL